MIRRNLLEQSRKVYSSIGLVIALSIVLVGFEWNWPKTKMSVFPKDCPSIDEDPIVITMWPEERVPEKPKLLKKPISKELPEKIEIVKEFDETDFSAKNQTFMEESLSESLEGLLTEEKLEEEILTWADRMPTLGNCHKTENTAQMKLCTEMEIQKILSNKLEYPEWAYKNGIEGTVYVTFVVSEYGYVEDIKLIRGVAGGEMLNKEALRAFGELPRFSPGINRGVPVKVRFSMPVVFKIRS